MTTKSDLKASFDKLKKALDVDVGRYGHCQVVLAELGDLIDGMSDEGWGAYQPKVTEDKPVVFVSGFIIGNVRAVVTVESDPSGKWKKGDELTTSSVLSICTEPYPNQFETRNTIYRAIEGIQPEACLDMRYPA